MHVILCHMDVDTHTKCRFRYYIQSFAQVHLVDCLRVTFILVSSGEVKCLLQYHVQCEQFSHSEIFSKD